LTHNDADGILKASIFVIWERLEYRKSLKDGTKGASFQFIYLPLEKIACNLATRDSTELELQSNW
jgi:hypothetical protein